MCEREKSGWTEVQMDEPQGSILGLLLYTICVNNRAGTAGAAGTVLAIPLLSRLTISRHGLYSRGRVASTWWRSIEASCSHFVFPELPQTPHQPSAGFIFP